MEHQVVQYMEHQVLLYSVTGVDMLPEYNNPNYQPEEIARVPS